VDAETTPSHPPRVTLGRMQNPVRGFLHGVAAIGFAVASGFLVARAEPGPVRIAAIVFGLGLLALYTTSALYHSIPWRPRFKRWMQRMDHSMIFVLIAASATPVTVLALDGGWRWTALVILWGVALAGILHRAVTPLDRNVLSITLMVILGWLGAPIIVSFANRIGVGGAVALAVGGILYTVGMVIMATGRPRLWPRVFSSHEVFHVLVVGASTIHFSVVFRAVAALPL
jgi:hemolysin III